MYPRLNLLISRGLSLYWVYNRWTIPLQVLNQLTSLEPDIFKPVKKVMFATGYNHWDSPWGTCWPLLKSVTCHKGRIHIKEVQFVAWPCFSCDYNGAFDFATVIKLNLVHCSTGKILMGLSSDYSSFPVLRTLWHF